MTYVRLFHHFTLFCKPIALTLRLITQVLLSHFFPLKLPFIVPVEITLNQNTTINSVTGGVLGLDVYKFYKITYFWDHDFNGLASYKIDGTL